jgi:hypothetical protein
MSTKTIHCKFEDWPVFVKITRTRSGDGSWIYEYEVEDFEDEPSQSDLADIFNEEMNRVD